MLDTETRNEFRSKQCLIVGVKNAVGTEQLTCEVSGKPADKLYEMRVVDPTDIAKEFTFRVCREAALEIVGDMAIFDFEGSAEAAMEWGKVASSDGETSFVNSLQRMFPGFVKRLSSFTAGEVTLFNGEQHSMLLSIAAQVGELRFPTERQVKAFNAIYDHLMEDKKRGKVLREETPDDVERRKKASDTLCKVVSETMPKFTPKTQEMLGSMVNQFKAKGILSLKQLDFMRRMVEQLPASLLAKYKREEMCE